MPLKKPKLLRQIRSFLIWGDSNRSRKFAMRLVAESGARTAMDSASDWCSAENRHLLDFEFFNRIGQKETFDQLRMTKKA